MKERNEREGKQSRRELTKYSGSTTVKDKYTPVTEEKEGTT